MRSRRTAIALSALAIGLMAVAAAYYQFVAKTLHPDIDKYYVISLDVSDIEKRVRSGEPFAVTLGNRQVELLMKPAPLVNGGLKVLERKRDRAIERTIERTAAFAGVVVGATSKSDARFTIAKGLLIGSVRIDAEWWFIEPLVKFQANAAAGDYIVYRARDTRLKIPFGRDTTEGPPGKGILPISGSQSITSALTTHTFRQAGAGSSGICTVLVADRDLMDWIEEVALVEWRENPELYMLSVLNSVNGVYQSEIGRQFIVTHILIDADNSFLSSTNRDTLLNQLVSLVTSELGDLRRERERLIHRAEVAHLLTGKEIDGDTVGYANMPGHYGFSQISFHHVQGYRFPLHYQNTLVMTHELGHNFNGVHGEADEWCVTHFMWCWDYVRTVMWDTLYEDNVDEFSDGSRNSSHNNLDRIRTNWEGRIGACDGPTIDSPTISSTTHTRGQASCNRAMTLNWSPPATPVGLQGYSCVVASQDDPYYDDNRTPDEIIDLAPTITSVTTPLLEPGHIWEFNLVAIDDVGTRSPYYSSFWAAIESCSVDVWMIPRENAVFSVGEWVNIYYGLATYDGLDVSGCYAVSLDMMKGTSTVQNIVTDMSYTLSYGVRVPEVEPASDYSIRIRLDREPVCDQYSGVPAAMAGTSNEFSVVVP